MPLELRRPRPSSGLAAAGMLQNSETNANQRTSESCRMTNALHVLWR